MPDHLAPAPKRGFGKWRWAAVALAAVAVLVTSAVVSEWFRQDRQPTVYHHADGHYSLNREDGPAATPEDIRRYLESFKEFGRLRLIANPESQVEDFGPFFNTTGEAGLGEYRMEVNGSQFEFSLPGCLCIHAAVPVPLIIDLRSPDLPPLDGFPKDCETVILVDGLTTCEEVVKAASPQVQAGKSVAVCSDKCLLFHYPSHGSGPGKWVPRRSPWWEDHIQPQLDRLKKLF